MMRGPTCGVCGLLFGCWLASAKRLSTGTYRYSGSDCPYYDYLEFLDAQAYGLCFGW